MGRSPKPIQKDYYSILEVSPRVSQEVLKAAYRALALLHHPDHGGDTDTFREITEAYDVLSNESARSSYDHDRENLQGKVIGEYRVLEEIAEGGFGKTYKGEHIIAKEPVCLKHCSRISPQHEKVLIQEAKAMWDLRHFAIPAVRNLLRLDDSSLALVMSYVPGPTLDQIVQKVGRIDAEHVAWIMERLLNALRYIHYHGVVHGDLKPQNVIIQPESHTVVMVDFGLAMVKPAASSGSKGFTPFFAPPEEINGETLVPESDFYSLGMTMLYALCGNLDLLARKQVPSDTPDALCDFIKRLIVKDVMARPSWEKEDLTETIHKIRLQDFGRDSTRMSPIPGL